MDARDPGRAAHSAAKMQARLKRAGRIERQIIGRFGRSATCTVTKVRSFRTGTRRNGLWSNEVAIHVARRLAIGFFLASLLLTGCLPGVPSASHPSCSWTTQPPSNADAICVSTYDTLQRLLEAAIRGDRATLLRLVPDPIIRHRIAVWGAMVRRKGNISVHVTPSFTLATIRNGSLGAEFNIVGHTHHGDVKAPQTVYLALRAGRRVVVQDQPMQEW